MSLSCDDGEPCAVHRHKVMKARKQHKCSACSAPILPGHYYANVFAVSDGGADTIKRCGSCETTWQHLYRLCQAHNKAHPYNDSLYPDETLSCGLKYEEEWGDLPDDIAALPLLGSDERGSLLAPKVTP